jgi:CO/xanthine dehydrogenase FAD-binding subunit
MSAVQPQTLGEALAVLADPERGAVPVAGCTDLMVVDHATGREHKTVVDVLRLPELQGIALRDGCVDIGAASTFTEIRENALIQEHCPILVEVAATIGAWQIQNRATIGGNIANASPAGDSLPVLLALNAQCVLVGQDGQRCVSYDHMHLGYRKTALQPGELILRIRIPLPSPWTVQLFKKVGTREAQSISKVVVAFVADLSEGRMQNVRIAAGSVAAIPLRLAMAEKVCEGAAPSSTVAGDAGRSAGSEVSPIDDVRSSADYRRFALERVVRRMVLQVGDSP